MLTNTPTLGQAVEVYRAAVKTLGLSDYSIRGWGPGYKLPQLVDPDGWLAPWMLKSDEVAVCLLGKRIWPFAYVADSNACEGVSPRPLSECDSPGKQRSYEAYACIDGEERLQQWPLAAKICQFALLDSLDVYPEAREVEYRPLVGMYDIAEPLQPGEILPFPSEELISAHRLQVILARFGRSLGPTLRQAAEPGRREG